MHVPEVERIAKGKTRTPFEFGVKLSIATTHRKRLTVGMRKGIAITLKAVTHRRSPIDPLIGHMKMDERLGRNSLKEALDDALHALRCGVGLPRSAPRPPHHATAPAASPRVEAETSWLPQGHLKSISF